MIHVFWVWLIIVLVLAYYVLVRSHYFKGLVLAIILFFTFFTFEELLIIPLFAIIGLSSLGIVYAIIFYEVIMIILLFLAWRYL